MSLFSLFGVFKPSPVCFRGGLRGFAKKVKGGGGLGLDGVGGMGGMGGMGGGPKMSYTKNQQLYIDALNDPNVTLVIAVGSAGTGKTFIGCQWGLQYFLESGVKRMIVTRPLIPVSGEEIGFIPGGIVSKMEPWTRPIYDAFLGKLDKRSLDKYIMDGNIEMLPLAFMRGRTFSDAFIFADEIQNSTPEQMLMLLTRVGNGSKIVISGDLAQSDIHGGNGLADFVDKLGKWNGTSENIRIIHFDRGDVRRSHITAVVLDIYRKI